MGDCVVYARRGGAKLISFPISLALSYSRTNSRSMSMTPTASETTRKCGASVLCLISDDYPGMTSSICPRPSDENDVDIISTRVLSCGMWMCLCGFISDRRFAVDFG